MLSTKKLIYKILNLLDDPLKFVTYSDVQITWTSTSNPYAQVEKNVALAGYTPISFTVMPTGSGGTTIYMFNQDLWNNTVTVGLRMDGTPASTTQNKVQFKVLYAKTALLG